MNKLFVTRAYNSIKYNKNNFSIIKKSSNDKLSDEINYIKNLPQSLKRFFPFLINYNNKKNQKYFSMELEFFPHPNLGTLMIEKRFNKKLWIDVAKLINIILKNFTKENKKSNFKKDQIKMYINKTEEQFKAFKSMNAETFKLCSSDKLKINGKYFLNFEIIWPEIKKIVNKRFINNKCSNIHGDLCFSNILFGSLNNNSSIKLIDPRGSFGKLLNTGDIYYDLAKLRHSLNGAYEYIIFDKFKIKTNNHNYSYKFQNDNNKRILKIFDEYVFSNYNYEKIKTLEGLIFIGMCARHYDSFKRQTCMYLTGIKNLNEVFNKL